MRIALILVLLLAVLSGLAARAEEPVLVKTQPATTEPSAIVPLWSGAAPGALGEDPTRDIPTLTLFLPAAAKAPTAAIVICPGGGYGHLAAHEGKDYALWLNQRGIAGLVLKYRLGSAGYRHPVMLHDLQRAIRLARAKAAEWNLDPGRVGVMGSSAGGHLASTAMTHFDSGDASAADPVDRQSARPDLGILCYPVITMGSAGHSGTRQNLLGKEPSPDLIRLLSSEQQVTENTPPCFIWSTADDPIVPVQNSLLFAQALADRKVPFEVHIYPHGPHGQGLGIHNYDPFKSDPSHLLPWTHELERWLVSRNFR